MANPESENSFHEIVLELERLVEVWKNLGHSYMNLESITDLITQKLVGLGTLDENDLHGTSLKDLGRLVDIRNTILGLEICSTRNYGEHWGILDSFLKKMITVLSTLHPVDATSDLRCLGTLEGWAAISFQMMKYPLMSPESNSLLDHVVGMGLNVLWEAFEQGLVVKDDASSMRVLEIAAKLRDTLPPQFHMLIDKVVAQKLRILSIRQAGKSDPSLNEIVQSVQKPSAFSEEQENVHQNSNKQDIGFRNGDSKPAVRNVEMGDRELNQRDLSTVSWVHEHEQGSLHHLSPRLDKRALDTRFASLLSGVTAGEKENPERSIQELEAENRDLILHNETLEEDLRKQKAQTATMKKREASSEREIGDSKEEYAKIKEELWQMTEAHEDRKIYATRLHNELVEKRQSQFMKAVKINELKEAKEALTRELRDAKDIIDRTKLNSVQQWCSNRSHEGIVKAKEQEKHSSAPSSYVPVYLRSTRSARTMDNTWAKDPEDDKDGSSSSIGEVTPTSCNDSMHFLNKS